MIPIRPPAQPVRLAPPGGRIAGTIGGDGDRSATGRPVRSRGRPAHPDRRLDPRPARPRPYAARPLEHFTLASRTPFLPARRADEGDGPGPSLALRAGINRGS